MVAQEKIRHTEYSSRPKPGSIEHLKFLTQRGLPAIIDSQSLDEYMVDSEATRTIGLFTKRLRIFRPIRTSFIELDSRMLETEEAWIPLFRSSIYRPKLNPQESLIQIHGQPKPWEIGEENYTYDIVLPVDFNFHYDPRRHTQAVIRHGVEANMEVYNQAAHPRYHEDNPDILLKALNHAAVDMHNLVRYLYGVDRVPSYIEPGVELNSQIQTSKQRVAQTIASILGSEYVGIFEQPNTKC